MKTYDVCGFIGNWPFRKLYKNTMDDLLEVHRKDDVAGGLVGCLESVFYNDPYESDTDAAGIVNAHPGYRFAMSANPLLPGAVDDLAKGKDELNAAAVRLYPSYHGYSPDDEKIVTFCKEAGKAGLRVIVTSRMEDERIDYLLYQKVQPALKVIELAKKCPETKFLISGAYNTEITKIAEEVNRTPNVWVDTACFKHVLFTYDVLFETVNPDKVIFGAGFPLYTFKCQQLNLATCRCKKDILEKVAYGNYETFMK